MCNVKLHTKLNDDSYLLLTNWLTFGTEAHVYSETQCIKPEVIQFRGLKWQTRREAKPFFCINCKVYIVETRLWSEFSYQPNNLNDCFSSCIVSMWWEFQWIISIEINSFYIVLVKHCASSTETWASLLYGTYNRRDGILSGDGWVPTIFQL